MKINVSFNIENSKRGWAAVANHVKHDPHQKHANKDIEPELRLLDTWGLTAEYGVREWQEKKFGAFVQAHDEKLKKQGRREKDRYYNSVQGFLGRKNRQTAVVTFGNNDSWKQLIRNSGCREGKDYTVEHENKGNGNTYEWYKLNPDSKRAKELRIRVMFAFREWRRGINASPTFSKYMQLGRCAVHMDEHGAPHMHVEVAFCGKTKKGAPTPSMSAAITQLATELTGKEPRNNREAFHCFRDATDRFFVEKLNTLTAPKDVVPYRNPHELNIEPFTLERTGRDTSRDMKTFKATEDQRLAEERQLKYQRVQLADEKEDVARRKEELERQVQAATRQIQLQRQQQQAQLEQMQREDKKLREENARLKKENKSLKERMKAFVGVAREACSYVFGPETAERTEDSQTLADGLRKAWDVSKDVAHQLGAFLVQETGRVAHDYEYQNKHWQTKVAMKGRKSILKLLNTLTRDYEAPSYDHAMFEAERDRECFQGINDLFDQVSIEGGPTLKMPKVRKIKPLHFVEAREELWRERYYHEWEPGTPMTEHQQQSQQQHDYGPGL